MKHLFFSYASRKMDNGPEAQNRFFLLCGLAMTTVIASVVIIIYYFLTEFLIARFSIGFAEVAKSDTHYCQIVGDDHVTHCY
jgi:hypothetical protein